jgi:hypothetical protein
MPWAPSVTLTILFDISTKQNCYAMPMFLNTLALPMESVCHPHIRHGHKTLPLTWPTFLLIFKPFIQFWIICNKSYCLVYISFRPIKSLCFAYQNWSPSSSMMSITKDKKWMYNNSQSPDNESWANSRKCHVLHHVRWRTIFVLSQK